MSLVALNGIKKNISLVISTVGVGYIPLAPGTWGSMVGVALYLAYVFVHDRIRLILVENNWTHQQYSALFFAITAMLLIALSFVAIWASSKASEIFEKKDPQKVVIDEVLGQLIVFAFLPIGISRWLIVAGFLLFRLFDIWKPYPVRVAESLPNGLGICADDIVAGVYGGVCLSIIYAISLVF